MSYPLRPSGLIGTPPSHVVQDAIHDGLSLDLDDYDFECLALDSGFEPGEYLRLMLESYRCARWEHQNDGLPF